MSTLVRAFCSTRGAVFEGLLEPVHKVSVSLQGEEGAA